MRFASLPPCRVAVRDLAGRRFVPLAFTFTLAVAVGCAPALSSFQPAHVARKGGVQVETGLDVSIPTGTIGRSIDAAEALSDAAKQRRITEEEQRIVLDAATNLALNPPFLLYHFGLAYGVWHDLELGLRWASGAWQLGARGQILHLDTHGIDLSAGITVSRQKVEFPIDDILKIVVFDHFVRWNVAIPILAGQSGSWYRWWAGPRLIFSRAKTGVTLLLPEVPGFPAEEQVASVAASGAYVGGQAGFALGYKSLFLGFELTLVQLIASAEVQFLGATTDVDLDSFVVYPAIALMGDF